MKTLKTITAALLIALSSVAFAKDDASAKKLTVNYTINAYMDAMKNGNIKGLNEVLDPAVKYTVASGKKIFSYSRSEMLSSLKNYENIVQNCTTNYDVIEAGATQAIVKVTMKYDSFSKINLVTLSNSADGWKITNISASFN